MGDLWFLLPAHVRYPNRFFQSRTQRGCALIIASCSNEQSRVPVMFEVLRRRCSGPNISEKKEKNEVE